MESEKSLLVEAITNHNPQILDNLTVSENPEIRNMAIIRICELLFQDDNICLEEFELYIETLTDIYNDRSTQPILRQKAFYMVFKFYFFVDNHDGLVKMTRLLLEDDLLNFSEKTYLLVRISEFADDLIFVSQLIDMFLNSCSTFDKGAVKLYLIKFILLIRNNIYLEQNLIYQVLFCLNILITFFNIDKTDPDYFMIIYLKAVFKLKIDDNSFVKDYESIIFDKLALFNLNKDLLNQICLSLYIFYLISNQSLKILNLYLWIIKYDIFEIDIRNIIKKDVFITSSLN